MRKIKILTIVGLLTLSLDTLETAALDGYTVNILSAYTNVVFGEEFPVVWTIPVLSTTLDDWLGVFALGSANSQWITWKYSFLRGGDTTFDAPENIGQYHVRYFESTLFLVDTLAATSETLYVHPPFENSTRRPTSFSRIGPIVAIGDSLMFGEGATAGNSIPERLTKALGKEVINKGVVGLMSDDASAQLESTILVLNPRITIILLGGKDVLQKRDLVQTIANLRSIIRRLYEHNSMVILVGVQGGLFTDRLRDGFHALWQEERPAFVPNVLRGIAGNPLLLSDTVHPNNEGYRLMAERILPTLRQIDLEQSVVSGVLAMRMGEGSSAVLTWNEAANSFELLRTTQIGTDAFTVATNVVFRANGVASTPVDTRHTNQEFFRLRAQ